MNSSPASPDSLASSVPSVPSTRSGSSSFRTRPFVSFVILIGFLVLLASGVVLFVAPPGRVANWTQWTMWGLTKHDWGDLHITFAALFLLAGVLHVWLNWRPLLSYLRTRRATPRGWRWEWVVALVLGVGVWAGTRARVAPVSTLLAWSERWRQGWEDSKVTAPVAHAELLSLRELAAQAGVPVETAVERLVAGGVPDPGPDTEVRVLAEKAGLAPVRIFDFVRGDTGAVRSASRETGHGPGERGGRGPGGGGGGGGGGGAGGGAGGGPGQKTLAQLCADEGLDLAAVRARLEQRGFKVAPDRPMRELARDNGFDRPYELLAIIREK
jgi:uncharacterized membrane protein YgcG